MDRYELLRNELNNVLPTFEQMLCEKLDAYGIYYRIFSRIKGGDSIKKKINNESYTANPDKKIQDLIGIRIILYFQEDIDSCKKIFMDMFEQPDNAVSWEEYESHADTFSATKTNGVFLLPNFIQKNVLPYIKDLRIDSTFEIQLRTVLFEGWHEIEHDLRYKNKTLWDNYPKETRKLNSVLATLEMCDKYIEMLLDDLGENFLSTNNWTEMIQYHFLLKTAGRTIDPELESLITPTLAKEIFRLSKLDLIDYALKSEIELLTPNSIIYLVNKNCQDKSFYSAELESLYLTEIRMKEKRQLPPYDINIASYKEECAFHTELLLSNDNCSKEEILPTAAQIIYNTWLVPSLSELFPDAFAEPWHNFRLNEKGIEAHLQLSSETDTLDCRLSHFGLDEPGKRWTVSVHIESVGDNYSLRCMNVMSRSITAKQILNPYSRPKIYHSLAKAIGIIDHIPVQDDIVIINEDDFSKLSDLLNCTSRTLPVIVISYSDDTELNDSDSLLYRLLGGPVMNDSNFKANLLWQTAFVCHIYLINEKENVQLAQMLNETEDFSTICVRFFGKDFSFENPMSYHYYSYDTICHFPKDIYPSRQNAPYFFKYVEGAEAVQHELIELVHRDLL